MIKLLEPSLIIRCREEDKNDIQKMIKDIEKEYSAFMTKETGRADYNCSLTIMSERYITDAQDQGCGGIVMYTDDLKIVCPNMLSSRLQLAFEECLPQIRRTLFPEQKLSLIHI